MSHERRALSLEEISNWIREAASARSWRPGRRLAAAAAPAPEPGDFHGTRIQAALRQARQKTFVRMIKPLRGLFRNQGAVNNSLIEAARHLAAQNQEMLEQMGELREQVRRLQSQLATLPPEATPQNPADDQDVSCA